MTLYPLDSARNPFKPILGFRAKDALQAFSHYDAIPCSIRDAGNYVEIQTRMAGYNYVRFAISNLRDLVEMPDGISLFATIKIANASEDDPEYLVKKLRIVAVKGSDVETKIRQRLQKGQAMTVLGIPRISLKLVHWRINNPNTQGDPLDWDLPYEMVIMAHSPEN